MLEYPRIFLVSESVERTLVCALSIDSDWLPLIRDLIPTDFSDPVARAGFDAIRSLMVKGIEPDEFAFRVEMIHRRCEASFDALNAHAMAEPCVLMRAQAVSLVAMVREASARRQLRKAAQVLRQMIDDTDMPIEQITRETCRLVKLATGRLAQRDGATHETQTFTGLEDEEMRKIDVSIGISPASAAECFPIGIPQIDEIIGGGQRGQITAVGGFTSHCKSVVGLCAAEAWANHGAVYLATRDEDRFGIARRRAARHLGRPVKDLRASDWREMVECGTRNIWVDDEPVRVGRLVQKIEIFTMSQNLSGIVVDYWQQYSDSSEERDLSECSSQLLELAKRLNVPIMVLGQFKQMPRDQRAFEIPSEGEFKGSSRLAHDAQHVIMVQRPFKILPDVDPELFLATVRKNRGGECQLKPIRMTLRPAIYTIESGYVEPTRSTASGSQRRDPDEDQPSWNSNWSRFRDDTVAMETIKDGIF